MQFITIGADLANGVSSYTVSIGQRKWCCAGSGVAVRCWSNFRRTVALTRVLYQVAFKKAGYDASITIQTSPFPARHHSVRRPLGSEVRP